MGKNFDSRIRRLEKKLGKMAIDPIEEIIETYPEERLVRIILGSNFHRCTETEKLEALEFVRWSKGREGVDLDLVESFFSKRPELQHLEDTETDERGGWGS